jgi:hypothetical protein
MNGKLHSNAFPSYVLETNNPGPFDGDGAFLNRNWKPNIRAVRSTVFHYPDGVALNLLVTILTSSQELHAAPQPSLGHYLAKTSVMQSPLRQSMGSFCPTDDRGRAQFSCRTLFKPRLPLPLLESISHRRFHDLLRYGTPLEALCTRAPHARAAL